MTQVAQFSIQYYQYLNANAELSQNAPTLAKDYDRLIELYSYMWQTRLFDRRAIHLQRTGKLGTYPSAYGQEAIGVAMGAAMQTNDIFCPYYREHATYIVRGVNLQDLFQLWGGNEAGHRFPNNPHDFPVCIPIASQCLHATGAAFAVKYRKEDRAVVTTVGDGGTSKGDFYEAMNLAGCWKLPVVFVINNNQWAISVPLKQQTLSATLAQKAIAANIECLQVDGNDIIALTHILEERLVMARKTHQPFLIEAITYRLGDHTTADDAARYRSEEELAKAKIAEPIKRLRDYLTAKNVWDDSKEQALKAHLQQQVDEAVTDYEKLPSPQPTAMFDSLYDKLPTPLMEQYQELKEQNDE